MKRLVIALSALFLLAAGPPAQASGNAVVNATCIGMEPPSEGFAAATAAFPLGAGPGRACLKACKAGENQCTKFAKARFKCESQGLKATAKFAKAVCLADGQPKTDCANAQKVELQQNFPVYKTEFENNKGQCKLTHDTCKTKCTP